MMPREKSSGAANSSTSGLSIGISMPRMMAPMTPPSREEKIGGAEGASRLALPSHGVAVQDRGL